MRRILTIGVTAAVAIGAIPAALAAADVETPPLPDMLGTWTGTSRAVVAGTGGHYGEGEDAAAFRDVELTVEWTAQDGGRLIGTITSALQTEPKVAVLSADGVTMVAADSDGTSVGRLIDDDHFELCYTQSSIADTQIVASCVVFARVME